MKKTKEEKLELLYASFDRDLTPKEEQRLEEYLRDPAVKAEEEALRKTRDMLGKSSWHFGEGFSARVMERLAEEQQKEGVVEMEVTHQYFSLFRRIAAAGVAAIVVLLLSIYLTSGSLNKETVLGMDNLSEDNLVSYLLYEDFSE
jgi:negative regulator of sigma E activity